jgi:hypothetical protein
MNIQFNWLKFIFSFSIVVILFPSCSITKCRYSNGFNLNINSGFNKEKKEWLANKRDKTKPTDSMKLVESKMIQISTQFNSRQSQELAQKHEMIDYVNANIYQDRIEETHTMNYGNNIKSINQLKEDVVIKDTKRIVKTVKKTIQKETGFWDTWLGNALIEVAAFILGLILFLGIMYFVLMFETFSIPLQFLLIVIGLILFMVVLSELFNSATDAVFDIFTR